MLNKRISCVHGQYSLVVLCCVFQGFEWLDPSIPIDVPDYTEKEALSCLHYYIDRKWLQNPKCNVLSLEKVLLDPIFILK